LVRVAIAITCSYLRKSSREGRKRQSLGRTGVEKGGRLRRYCRTPFEDFFIVTKRMCYPKGAGTGETGKRSDYPKKKNVRQKKRTLPHHKSRQGELQCRRHLLQDHASSAGETGARGEERSKERAGKKNSGVVPQWRGRGGSSRYECKIMRGRGRGGCKNLERRAEQKKEALRIKTCRRGNPRLRMKKERDVKSLGEKKKDTLIEGEIENKTLPPGLEGNNLLNAVGREKKEKTSS